MCTIIVLHDVHPDRALIVGANRDEFRRRPTRPPGPIEDAGGAALAGRDERSGGTWMGAHRTGFFVGITNQRSHSPPDPSLRSRGLLALDALRIGDHDAVRDWLRSDRVDPRATNDFNLIFGEPGKVSVAYGRREDPTTPLEVRSLPPGVHVLANDRLGSPEFPRAGRAEALVRDALSTPWPALSEQLEAVLGDTWQPPRDAIPEAPPGSRFDRELLRELQALCILLPEYGTVSATILAADRRRGLTDYRYADGPPCRTPFVPVTI